MSKIKKILDIIFNNENKTEKNKTEKKKIEKPQYISNSNYSYPVKKNKHTNSSYSSKSIKKDFKKDHEFINVTELSKNFKIEPAELNKLFSLLKWAYKEDRWWLVTELGVTKGGKQSYNTRNKVKFIQWNKNIISNFELIEAVKGFRENSDFRTESLKEKGDRYETFTSSHYKELGYTVWEHGKEKGKLDGGIDLIVKKEKEIIFIQCKNWKESKRFQIDHVRVKASRAEARQFMKDNPLFVGYKMKFRYTISNDCMHPSAIKYIKETNGLFDYEILKMSNN